MSRIAIDYSEIYSSAKQARVVSGFYEEFGDELERKVARKLNGLPGHDVKGHIGSASSYTFRKIQELREKKQYYSDAATNIEKLAHNIEACEKKVISSVNSIAADSLELKNQGFFAQIAQWAYGTFCVDLVNFIPITRAIGNTVKNGMDWLWNKGSKIVDWFKHGEGRYYLSIALDALSAFGAACATIGAVTLAFAAGGPILAVAAIASVIGAVMTLGDTSLSIINKVKALKIIEDTGDPGQARYYGNINGVNDYITRTDMGGESANQKWGAVGKGYVILHTAADITALATGTIGAAGLSGTVSKNPQTGILELKTTYDPTKARVNLKSTILEKIGFRNVGGKWSFGVKNLFSTKQPTGTIPRLSVYKKGIIHDKLGSGAYDLYNFANKGKKVTGYPSKVYKAITNVEKLLSPSTSGYSRFKGCSKIIGDLPFNISSPVSDFNSTVVKIIDTVVDIAS